MGKTVTLNEREIEAVKWIIDKYLRIHAIIEDIPEAHHLVVMRQLNNIKKKIRDAATEEQTVS